MQHRPLSNDWIDLWLLSGVGAPVPGGRPSAEPGGGRAAAPLRGAALIVTTTQFGNATSCPSMRTTGGRVVRGRSGKSGVRFDPDWDG